MKKLLTILLFAISMALFTNCQGTSHGQITKTGKNTYAVEASTFRYFWFIFPLKVPFTTKMYLANCTAEASGALTCEKGNSSYFGHGAMSK